MAGQEYSSTQLLSTSINISPKDIKGNIINLILYNLRKRYEGVCNKDGYIEKDSIEVINRSIGMVKIINNISYITYYVTYKASVISPSKGNIIRCIISSNNKMGLIGYIKSKDSDTIEDSPFIIIVPREYFSEDVVDDIKVEDKINIKVENYRTKYMSKQIQIVARPV